MKRHMKDSNSLDIILQDIEQDDLDLFTCAAQRTTLPTLCTTRWLSRVDSLSTLLACYNEIAQALDEIKQCSSGSASADASSYLAQMHQFTFIISACLTQYMLAYIRPLSVALQSKSCDLVSVHDDTQALISTIQDIRNDDSKYNKIFKRAERIATSVGVTPTKPRTYGRQSQRANACASSENDDPVASQYYKVLLDYKQNHTIISIYNACCIVLTDLILFKFILFTSICR